MASAPRVFGNSWQTQRGTILSTVNNGTRRSRPPSQNNDLLPRWDSNPGPRARERICLVCYLESDEYS
jgi:hypothetical protein